VLLEGNGPAKFERDANCAQEAKGTKGNERRWNIWVRMVLKDHFWL